MRRRQLRRGVPQRDHFERRAHLRDLLDRIGVEPRDPNAATRHGDDEVLGFQLPKSLADRDMARVEFARDMVLPQWRVRLQRAADDAFAEGLGNAASRRRVLGLTHHRLSITKTGAETDECAYHRYVTRRS